MIMKMIMFITILSTFYVMSCVDADTTMKTPFDVHLIGGQFDPTGIEYFIQFKENADDMIPCEEHETHPFTAYDYSVVGAMLIISLGIGVFYGFFEKKPESATSTDFMLGSGMSIFPVTLSLTTSFITAIELLGNPAEIYFNGAQYALIVFAMILVIPVALKVFYPIYDSLKLTSCYEYLGVRFGKELRVFGAILYILQMCFYTSVSVLAPAIALSKATGLNTRLAIVLIYIVCIFYSSQGGLKAVVIADTFQTCVLLISLLLVLFFGTYMQGGGLAEIFKINSENGRLDFFDFKPNPTKRHTFYSIVIGGFFYWSSLFCVNQATVQKAMSLRNLSKAKIALTLAVIGLATLFLMNFFTGWIMFAHYVHCDPWKAGMISEQDQLMPFFIMDTFGQFTAFSGIFVAGVFAASLGTVAACLSSLSAVTLEDLCVCGLNIKISPQKATRYAKWMNFGYGILSFGLIFAVEGRSILQATLTLNGLIGGIALGLFSLGIFFKKANLKGALYGGLLSTALVITLGVFALAFGDDPEFLDTSVDQCNCLVNSTMSAMTMLIESSSSNDDAWYTYIYRISYMWYSMIGTFLTIILGLIASCITQYFSDKKMQEIADQIPKNKSGIFRKTSAATHPERKISTIAHNMVMDASSRIESSIRRAISNPHLPHLAHMKSEDKLNIVNEVSIQSTNEPSQYDNNINTIFQMFDDGKPFELGIDNKAVDLSYDISDFKKENVQKKV